MTASISTGQSSSDITDVGSGSRDAAPAALDTEVDTTDDYPPSEPGPVLTRSMRRVRMLVTIIVFALITLGTVHGQDDDFPFGPLRMYASRDNPNGAVTQAVVQAVTRSGRVLDVTNTSGAPRRAELEGRFSEFAAHPTRFGQVAATFVPSGSATAPDPVRLIRLVRRTFPLHDGRSGTPTDAVIATWTVPR